MKKHKSLHETNINPKTDRLSTEKQLQLLQTIIDNSLDIIQVFQSVRDQNNKIVDFIWIMNNKGGVAQNGDVIGSSLLSKNPGVIPSGIFDKMVSVVETGEPVQHEQYYHYEQFEGWFYQALVKSDDGLVMTSRDISKQKKAEQGMREQSHFINSITEMMPDVVSVAEFPSRNILYANRDTLTWIGFEVDEIQKMPFKDRIKLFHPEDIPAIQEFYERFHTLKDREENKVEYRIKDNNEQWVIISLRGQVFARDKNNNPSQLLFVAQNITAQKNAEKEILSLKDEIAEHAEDKYRTLFNSIDEGFLIHEMVRDEEDRAVNFRLMEVNPAFTRQTGLGNDTVGKLATEFLPNLEKSWIDTYDRVARSGVAERVENYNQATQRWYNVHVSRVGHGNRQVAVLFDDITERKESERILQENQFQLKDLLKQRSEFIVVASHELKTPVTSIKAYAEIVQERLEEIGNLEDSVLLGKLNEQIDRLTILINNLLDITKIEQGKMPIHFEYLALDTILEERIQEIQRTTNHKIELIIEQPLQVKGDKQRIEQVITNLLSNAVKYSPKESLITVESNTGENDVTISIADEGYGIPEKDLDKVFDKFFRVTTNNMDTFPGMGLGLYLAAQIVLEHGGRIWVESIEGKGSVFYFTLPLIN